MVIIEFRVRSYSALEYTFGDLTAPSMEPSPASLEVTLRTTALIHQSFRFFSMQKKSHLFMLVFVVSGVHSWENTLQMFVECQKILTLLKSLVRHRNG